MWVLALYTLSLLVLGLILWVIIRQFVNPIGPYVIFIAMWINQAVLKLHDAHIAMPS